MRYVTWGLIGTAIFVAATIALIPKGPMGYGWDWPGHDWWHTSWARGWGHRECGTVISFVHRPDSAFEQRSTEPGPSERPLSSD